MFSKKDGRVVSFMNMKGGVGKTTLCLGLGYYLAKSENKKILFIDLDPQFNLTQSLLNEYNLIDKYLENSFKYNNICKIFDTKSINLGEKPKPCKPEEVIETLDENLDLIYGSIYLIKVENGEQKKYQIKNFINENKLKEKYDFIFIDCPPTISLYTSSALHASDYYVIPNRIDRYSILGIKLLNDAIKQEEFNSDRKLDIRPLGIIYTMVPNIINQRTKDIMREFEVDEIVAEMGLFESVFNEVNHLVEGKQGNIASKYYASKKSIKKISNEFIERLGEYE